MKNNRLLTIFWVLIVGSSVGCAVTKANGMRDLQDAWSLMQDEKVTESMELAKKYLNSSDAEEIFLVGLLYSGKAGRSKASVQAKKDAQCGIALLEKSANLGHINAASTLEGIFRFDTGVNMKDVARANCWAGVVEKDDQPKACAREKDLSACK